MKRLAKARLSTPYSLSDIPLSDYPRPQLVRNSYICLNGTWDFDIVKSDIPPKDFGRKILVPFPPESALSGLEVTPEADEYMFYRRTFTLPEGFIKDRVILHFGAVDQVCTLFINRKEMMTNEGGYLPFFCDITDALNGGENEILLRVRDTLSHIYPYGKQTKRRGGMWYTPVSGIWQTVWLESLPKDPIRSIKLTPSISSVKIEVDTEAEVKTLTLSDGTRYEFSGKELVITPDSPILWTPENPHLYYFTLTAGEDRVESYFALREIGIREICGKRCLCLNGAPYLFNGLLDQGYFPDGIFLPPSYEAYADDIRLAKSMGFNMLRKHIKLEPMIFYHLCDKLGIAVFQDAVNNSDYSFFFDTALPTVGVKKQLKGHRDKRTREVFTKNLTGLMDRLYNCPSVVQYTVFNEGWGQFLPDENYRLAKARSGGRVIDATSGWFHVRESDFDSRHIYFKPLKVKRRSDRPLFISEFGGYSLKVEGHTFGDGVYGYRKFQDREEFESAVIALYENEVTPLIDEGLCALVMTQLSDIEDEINGFITYDRRSVKLNTDKMLEVNSAIYARFNEKRGT
ncbi:MAG: glycoside hydrolase family 2 [Clostridia bacterium]|nr:glycoside hydrolase family 2 [Clostridia bacterium]